MTDFRARTNGDAFPRVLIQADGRIQLGAGSAAPDVELSRGAANRLDFALGDSLKLSNAGDTNSFTLDGDHIVTAGTGTGSGISLGGIEIVASSGSSGIQTTKKIFPGTAAGALQTACGISAGSGAPSNGDGADGDFYFRSDGTVAGDTVIYHKEGGTWTALTLV